MANFRSFAQSRLAWLILALSAIGLELTALFFQYGLKLDPCVLCIYQRLAVFGLFVAGLVGISSGNKFIRIIALLIWGYSAFIGLQFANELVAMQTNSSPFSTCGFLPDFPSFLPLHEWFPSILMPTGMCTDDAWGLWRLSMAQWMQVIFSCYLILLAIFVYPVISKIKKTKD